MISNRERRSKTIKSFLRISKAIALGVAVLLLVGFLVFFSSENGQKLDLKRFFNEKKSHLGLYVAALKGDMARDKD